MSEPVLSMKGITKIYGNGILANDKVDFSVNAGEIHALMGENGAGKSTLMKMIFGIEHPDEGEIYCRGQKVEINSPTDALKLGIGMVHQHFMLVPSPALYAGPIPLGGGEYGPAQRAPKRHVSGHGKGGGRDRSHFPKIQPAHRRPRPGLRPGSGDEAARRNSQSPIPRGTWQWG